MCVNIKNTHFQYHYVIGKKVNQKGFVNTERQDVFRPNTHSQTSPQERHTPYIRIHTHSHMTGQVIALGENRVGAPYLKHTHRAHTHTQGRHKTSETCWDRERGRGVWLTQRKWTNNGGSDRFLYPGR